MKEKIWIVSQDYEQTILALRVKRLSKVIYAYDESGAMVDLAEYETEHEAVEAMRDFIDYLGNDEDLKPYRMKKRGFDAR